MEQEYFEVRKAQLRQLTPKESKSRFLRKTKGHEPTMAWPEDLNPNIQTDSYRNMQNE